MRSLLTVGVALLAAALGAALVGGRGAAATVTVDAQDFAFSPPTINVTAGDTVQWSFAGASQHNVTAVDGSFSSASMSTGSFSHTFSAPGTYAYFCTFHGNAQGGGMSGTVVVAAAAPTNTPQPANTREPTDTPEATSTTAAASATAGASATATPIVVAPIAATVEAVAPAPSGGAGVAIAAPRAGTGPGGDAPAWRVAAAAMAAAGAGSIGGALALARRRRS